MDTYMAENGNIRFYIQPDKVEIYANAGYTIYRMEAVKVTDVAAELAAMPEEVRTCTVRIPIDDDADDREDAADD